MLRSLTNNCKAKTVYDRMNPNKGCEFGENPYQPIWNVCMWIKEKTLVANVNSKSTTEETTERQKRNNNTIHTANKDFKNQKILSNSRENQQIKQKRELI